MGRQSELDTAGRKLRPHGAAQPRSRRAPTPSTCCYCPRAERARVEQAHATRLDYSGGGHRPYHPGHRSRGLRHRASRARYGAISGPRSTPGARPAPGSSVWTASSADPGDAAAWSAWAADQQRRRRHQHRWPHPWCVAAVSQADQRTDLFVALLGGTSSRPGAIYTTYLQSTQWLHPRLCSCRRSPRSPIVTRPLDIPGHLSSSDLQARRYVIQQTFEANLAVPAGFTKPAPASTMTYLQEAYYFVPMYLANQLQQQGEFTAALDWYRTVYDYSVPEQARDIYYGLVLDAQQPSVYTLPVGLAVGSAEPACHRPDQALRLHPLHGPADRPVHVRRMRTRCSPPTLPKTTRRPGPST